MIGSWSYARKDNSEVFGDDSGDDPFGTAPPPDHDVSVAFENDGRRVLVRGVFVGGAPSNQVVPRRVACTESAVVVELEERRGDAELVVDVAAIIPYEVTVDLRGDIPEDDVPRRTIVRHCKGETLLSEHTFE